jgi:hypothetical protein
MSAQCGGNCATQGVGTAAGLHRNDSVVDKSFAYHSY